MDAIIEAQKELVTTIHRELNVRVHMNQAENAEYPYISIIDIEFYDNGSDEDKLFTAIFTLGIFTEEKTSKAGFKILNKINELLNKKNVKNQYYNIWFSFADGKFSNLTSKLSARYQAHIECLS